MDAQGTPTPSMQGEIEFDAIGQFVDAGKQEHALQDTTIIITAKHGQSPIDPDRFEPIPGHARTNGSAPSTILGAAYLPDSEINQIGAPEVDVSLLWLKPGASTRSAVALQESNAKAAAIGQIFYGASLEPLYGKPGLLQSGANPRTPDIIITPNVGVIYTGSLKKQAEHGDSPRTIPTSCPGLESCNRTAHGAVVS